MLQLPNGCVCSGNGPAVHPKNWRTTRRISGEWFIFYRFHDPLHGTRQIRVRGMNEYPDVNDRRAVTNDLLLHERQKLFEGFNPITREINSPPDMRFEIDPEMPFLNALKEAEQRVHAAPVTLRDLKKVNREVGAAAKALGFDRLPIKDCRRRHLKLILEKIEEKSGKQSAHRYNRNRTYLMMLFAELTELEAVEFNPVRDMRKRKVEKKIRDILAPEERQRVTLHLFMYHRTFYRFANIFFHSGSRTTELLAVKGTDVDLARQRFKVMIKKGRINRQVWKPIKDIALPFWIDAMATCKPEHFVFSRNLEPGEKQIQAYQITKRWYRNVKKPLGITKDFYALKHLNTDETAELLGIEAAALQNSHTTPVITMRYAVNEKARNDERIKRVNNPL